MNQFIITKLNTINNKIEVIAVEQVKDDKESSFKIIYQYMLDDIEELKIDNKDNQYIINIDDKLQVSVYRRNGYITNSKILEYIYNIIYYSEDDEENNDF